MLAALIVISFSSTGSAQTAHSGPGSASVRIGVLGLFHPRELTVSALQGHALVVHAGGETIVLAQSSGVNRANVKLSGNEIMVQAGTRTMRASSVTTGERTDDPEDFVLTIPGKITRKYRGTLEIRQSAGYLLSVVTMDRETAVASVVAAESTADTPFEALKAQAVATRSYLAAGRGRHYDFDFCDTTHCQFLREPPLPGTAFARAIEATRDLVLAYELKQFAAMYTRSCGGRTRTPAEVDLPTSTYPYYAVECTYCRTHPVHWSSRISAEDAATLRSSSEPARLRIARQSGWNTIPSNDFTVRKDDGEIHLDGTGQGHGIGLCQAGAKAMAADGADFRQILNHYYPNSSIVRVHPAFDSSLQQ